jgi:polysaccharide deacetylase 2 family uncharacterized protein YibQ
MTNRKKRPNRKKKSGRKKTPAVLGQKMRVLLASLFLVAFVGLCLVLLVNLRSSFLPEEPYEEKLTEAVLPKTEPEPTISYADIYEVFNAELLSGPHSEGWQKLPAKGDSQRLKMFGDYPDRNHLLDLYSKIIATGAPAQLDLLPRKGLVRLYWKNELRLELRYRVPIEVISSRPQIAIIMDDMGRSVSTFRKLLEIDLMVTPAILPESSNATEAAHYLQDLGREYMIHLPMQPKSYPRINPGANALLLGQTEMQTRKLLRRYMERVPGASGGNNHMGSGYTQNRKAMRVVLDELKQGGYYFIDSKTISTSVAYDEARRMKLPAGSRQIFLDNEEDVDYIRRQIRKMVRMSDDRGEVIAICHPYPETLQALRQELDWLKQQQVEFVPASTLAKVY